VSKAKTRGESRDLVFFSVNDHHRLKLMLTTFDRQCNEDGRVCSALLSPSLHWRFSFAQMPAKNPVKERVFIGYYTDEVAPCGGEREAMLFGYFRFRLMLNREKGLMIGEDNRVWMHYTLRKLTEHFPSMSKSTIQRKIKRMEELGVIKCAEYCAGSGGHSKRLRFTTKGEKVSGLVKLTTLP